MSITNRKTCPVCGKELSRAVWTDDCGAIHVTCDNCGKYAMTMEFYEDRVEQASKAINRAKLALVLKNHKADSSRPFFSENPISVPAGFHNYTYQVCILGTKLDK